MGTKFGDEVAPQQEGSEIDKERGILEKYAWQEDRGMRDNPLCDIIRTTNVGEDASAGIQGTDTQVPGLSGLECWVESELKAIAQKYGDIAEEGDKQFILYDQQIVSTDLLSYNGDLYSPVGGNIWYYAPSGRCEVLARIHAET